MVREEVKFENKDGAFFQEYFNYRVCIIRDPDNPTKYVVGLLRTMRRIHCENVEDFKGYSSFMSLYGSTDPLSESFTMKDVVNKAKSLNENIRKAFPDVNFAYGVFIFDKPGSNLKALADEIKLELIEINDQSFQIRQQS